MKSSISRSAAWLATYAAGEKISKKVLRELKVECEEFHGEWNYVIRSRMERRVIAQEPG